MGLFSRIKDWATGDILTEADLEAEFDNIYDSVVAGTTTAMGMVQLEDSHASTSVAKAACPKNVKEAYDLAGTMLTKATFNANSIVKADSDDTPIVLTVAASQLVGRKAAGGIDALAKADVHTILNIEDGATKYPDTGEQAFLDADHTKLNAIEAGADITDATNVAAATAIMDADFAAAGEIMVGTGTGTHSQVTIAASQMLGRKAAGAVVNLSTTEVRALINVEDDADVTDATNVNAAGAVVESDYNANTFLYAVDDNTPVVKTRAETIGLLSGQAAADFAMNTHKLTGLSVPSAAGHSIRATASITEVALEDAITKKHAANADTALGSGAVSVDHGAAATDQIVNVCYGTGDPPAANTTTIGSLFVKYTA